eukprot:TRINITY_DN1893_c0_g1_i4.p1 TRINITY_DN1893_c0_g1~~TRINITY_DN1893_c0_g1_i4.p1  ORF type:complete len:476 (+),score=134.90 TRINITY_DN1893_c0_g1_i4:27-1430(+)
MDDDDEDRSKKGPKKKVYNDDDGTTLFLRNISYQTEEEDLKEKFEEFGPIVYCFITRNRETGESKGTGFVRFKTKEAADLCMQTAYQSRAFEEEGGPKVKLNKNKNKKGVSMFRENESDIVVDGRRLIVAPAVPKEKAVEIDKKKKEEKQKSEDKRNLHLAEVGVIKPDSEEGQELPVDDRNKRATAWKEKKIKLANPNFHVSKTRLAVRNIPKDITEVELKELFKKVALQGTQLRSKPPAMKQVKIVFDDKVMDKSGKPTSRGFGFVEFKHHEHAYDAILNSNNIQGIVPRHPERRLIVDFALENVQKLQKRDKKMASSNNKNSQNKRGRGDDNENGSENSKRSPFGRNRSISKDDNNGNQNGNQDNQSSEITPRKNRRFKSPRQRNNKQDNKSPKANKKGDDTPNRQRGQKRRFENSRNDEPPAKKRRPNYNNKKEMNQEKKFDKLVHSYSGSNKNTRRKKWEQE